MGLMDEIARIIGGGPMDQLPKERQGVGEDYGLRGAKIDRWRSPYQKTLDPGEERSTEDLQSMLADVILSAGSAAIPSVGPRSQSRKAPGRVYHGATSVDGLAELKAERGGKNTPLGKLGTFWTESPEVAALFTRKPNPQNRAQFDQVEGGRIIRGEMNPKNPMTMDALDYYKRFVRPDRPEVEANMAALQEMLAAKKHDSVRIKANPKADDYRSNWAFPNEFSADQWIALDPSIVSAR